MDHEKSYEMLCRYEIFMTFFDTIKKVFLKIIKKNAIEYKQIYVHFIPNMQNN